MGDIKSDVCNSYPRAPVNTNEDRVICRVLVVGISRDLPSNDHLLALVVIAFSRTVLIILLEIFRAFRQTDTETIELP